jgi:chaperonin GroEL (HSP60 family)
VAKFQKHKVDVKHPAAKSMIELARAQDEAVGDGTTSVVILGNYDYVVVVVVILMLLF